MTAALVLPLLLIPVWFTAGCGVKMEQLPVVSFPYVSEIEFLKEVRNVDGKAKKKRFKRGRITSPFYFFLKIKEVENNGSLAVIFYTNDGNKDKNKGKDKGKDEGKVKDKGKDKKVVEKSFHFGKPGKYYEYIIFFDRVEDLKRGKHRYAIFYNGRLIYEDYLVIDSLSR